MQYSHAEGWLLLIGAMTTRQISADDWDKMEDADMVITDVGIVSKKEKAPSQDYFVVSLIASLATNVWLPTHLFRLRILLMERRPTFLRVLWASPHVTSATPKRLLHHKE